MIKKVILIDDDLATNFINQKIIEEAKCVENIIVFQSAINALNYLEENKESFPDIILLDLNMPKMNGWEFLEEYTQLSSSFRKEINIYILSTSKNSQDIEKAAHIQYVKGYITKPLTAKKFIDVYNKHCVYNG